MSRIDELLTPIEKQVLLAYRSPEHSGMRRATRLSVQYAVAAGVFVLLCISEQQPLWCLAVYAIFLIQLVVRLLNARRMASVMPGVIEKYESRIAQLEFEVEQDG